MVDTREILALVDDIQAGDCSELVEHYDHPVNITPGKKLVTQLGIYLKDHAPESSPTKKESREVLLTEFSQPTEGSAFTRFRGKVVRSLRGFVKPYDQRPGGTTYIEVLAIAEEIPVLLGYSWDGDVDVNVPAKDDPILAEGKLYCEPGFAYGTIYSPVKADILETRMLQMDRKSNKMQDWGILRLRLQTDIRRFDLVGDNLMEDAVFVRVSDFNPPLRYWEAYLKRVYGRRWKKIWKRTTEDDWAYLEPRYDSENPIIRDRRR